MGKERGWHFMRLARAAVMSATRIIPACKEGSHLRLIDFVSLNSRFESNKGEKRRSQRASKHPIRLTTPQAHET